jgi:arginyl-tRNA synthetase
MASQLQELSQVVGDAFVAEGLSRDHGEVKRSDRPDLGEFQCNGALAAAKAAQQNPKAIAEKVATRLKQSGVFSDVTLAGPGFINLTLKPETHQKRIAAIAADERLGVPNPAKPETVLIDFGGPNVAKPMHVGHLRSSIIGDSLQRLFRFAGNKVTSDIHLGDWGKPMGQLISEIKHRQPQLPYFDPSSKGPYPEQSPVTMDDLEELYPAASAASKTDEARDEEARQATAELQAGRPGYRALWKHFVDVSIVGLKREFASLGVKFDEWKGEAAVDALIEPMIADLRARGIATESEGALIIVVTEEGDKKEIPPLILLKSDGAVLYGTTDLATVIDRVRTHNPSLVLYVVDQRQHDHFEQVFRAAKKAGISGKATLEHVGFGTMNGPDGRPFKTRAGGVMKLYDLIEMGKDEALKRLAEQGLANEYPEAERLDIATKVGIAAIKFADLANHRLTNYIFDLDRFTRFEGKTGPYLQYQAVRIKSLMRKAEEIQARPGPIKIDTPAERALALEIASLPEVIGAACERRAPNLLCEYVFAVAQAYSRFWTEHHILSESDHALRGSRLALSQLTLRVLESVLGLLGIEIPERM